MTKLVSDLKVGDVVAYLDERWGAGVGSSRERARLARELETSDAESA
jgi:hypothetical protein